MAVEFTNPLDSIKVASPCSADWDAMVGNNRQRFCGQCKMNVYNLSGMTKREAEELLMNAEGKLCARFFKRSDGTVITKDCPVGWQKVRKTMSKFWTATASLAITLVSGIGITTFMNSGDSGTELMGNVAIDIPHTPEQKNTTPEIVMGEVPFEVEEKPIEIMGGIVEP